MGENVFLGVNTVVLMGAHIGNNVIVGAGSVVHGHIPDNVVIAGVLLNNLVTKRREAL